MVSDFVDQIVPPWAKGAATSHFWRFWRFLALLIDLIVEGVWQGKKDSFPNQAEVPGFTAWGGYTDTLALTKYLAPDAGVIQGLTETIPDLAQRVRHAQLADGWPAAGTVRGVFEQLAGVLNGPNGPPKMMIVDRHSQWWVRNQDGTVDYYNSAGNGLHFDANWNATGVNTTVSQPWHWDFMNVPDQPGVPDRDGAGEWWLVLFANGINLPNGVTPNSDFTLADIGVIDDQWNNLTTVCPVSNFPDEGTIGCNLPLKLVNLIVAVIKSRQTSGFECSHCILAFDDDSFKPDGSSVAGSSRTAYPDQLWGEEVCLVGGVWVLSRLLTAEFVAVGPWAYRSNVP